VAFRLRNIRSLNRQRLICAVALLALIPIATEIPALASLAILAALLPLPILWETFRLAPLRDRIRHELAHERVPE
jgi:hypothetical protein